MEQVPLEVGPVGAEEEAQRRLRRPGAIAAARAGHRDDGVAPPPREAEARLPEEPEVVPHPRGRLEEDGPADAEAEPRLRPEDPVRRRHGPLERGDRVGAGGLEEGRVRREEEVHRGRVPVGGGSGGEGPEVPEPRGERVGRGAGGAAEPGGGGEQEEGRRSPPHPCTFLARNSLRGTMAREMASPRRATDRSTMMHTPSGSGGWR